MVPEAKAGISLTEAEQFDQSYWWRKFSDESLWCGVFQGGGAKGIAFAGALAALEDHGQWFTAVAGASAGAIAAALVAAGYRPAEIEVLIGELLEAVRPETLIDQALYWSRICRSLTRYSSVVLEATLDTALREAVRRLGHAASAPITFGSLAAATSKLVAGDSRGIGLYVVVLDATLGLPVPYCGSSR